MNIQEFVNKVFLRYPPAIRGNDTEEDVMVDYLKGLTTGKDYDYEEAFTDLMRSYPHKTLPTVKFLLEILQKNEVFESKKSQWQRLKPLWAFKKRWYEFSIPPGSNESEACKWLVSKGFGNITNQKPEGA